MSDISKAHDKAFAMLSEGFDLEWKEASPKRSQLNKKEDVAFIRAQKKKLRDQRRAIDKILKPDK